MIRQILKFIGIFSIIIGFLLVTSVVWIFVRNRWKRTRIWSKILTRTAKLAVRNFSIQINPIGLEKFPHGQGVLMVGNHLSYIDVIIIGSLVTTCFVTSTEIKETPFLGQICQMAGCLFVERRSRLKLTKEISELSEALTRHLNVTIFPEATSTNGEAVLRFRRPLFLASIQSQKPVIPICLNYRFLDSTPVDISNRDQICWYGDMPFLSHLWNLCGIRKIKVDLSFLPPLLPETAEPGDLAAQSHIAVESTFRPFR